MKHEILCNGYNRFHINIGQLERYNEFFLNTLSQIVFINIIYKEILGNNMLLKGFRRFS